jgi:hypothetical protein
MRGRARGKAWWREGLDLRGIHGIGKEGERDEEVVEVVAAGGRDRKRGDATASNMFLSVYRRLSLFNRADTEWSSVDDRLRGAPWWREEQTIFIEV